MNRFLLAIVFALSSLVFSAPNANAVGSSDYAVTGFSGTAEVLAGENFNRTLDVVNQGDAGGNRNITLIVKKVAANFVSVTSSEGVCSPKYFANGNLNLVKCVKVRLLPGETATMTVEYSVPTTTPVGKTYLGVGVVNSVVKDVESDTTNNSSSGAVTTVVAPSISTTVTDAQYNAAKGQMSKAISVSSWDGEDWVVTINRWTKAETESTFDAGVVGTYVPFEPGDQGVTACGPPGQAHYAPYGRWDYPGDSGTVRLYFCNFDNEFPNQSDWVIIAAQLLP